MPKSAQTAQRFSERRKWHQRKYSDHEGNPVILGKESFASEYHDPEGNYAHKVQLYSTTPIHPENYNLMYRFLFDSTDLGPFIEIYTSPQPNAIACVEHQRREIAFRKNLHIEADRKPKTDNLPPLIAKREIDTVPNIYEAGACLLLTSESFLAQCNPEETIELGAPPVKIYFNRQFPDEIRKIDLISRIEELHYSVLEFTQLGNQVLPEALEIHTKMPPTRSQPDFYDQDIEAEWRMVCGDFWERTSEIDLGVEEQPLEQKPWTSHQVQTILENQHRGNNGIKVSLSKGSDTTGVTIVAKNYDPGENDLQYVVDVLFLASIADSENISLLETTARVFTTRFLMELEWMKKRKRVKFEFRIPGQSLSSVMEFPHSFPVGAYQQVGHFKGTHTHTCTEMRRVVPVDHNEIPWVYKPRWNKFAVVLDKPAFITEPGVLFMIHNLEDPETHRSENIVFRRSAGMSQVADRLSMLAIENKRRFEDVRWLTDTEFREVHDMSLEEYHSALPITYPDHRQ